MGNRLRWLAGKLAVRRASSRWAFPLLMMAALVAQWLIGDAGRDGVAIPLAGAIVWASLIDRERQILPNVLTIGLVLGGLVWAMRPGGDVVAALVGAGAGYLVFTLTGWLFRRLRGREGLGQGDSKFFAACGAWLGWAALPAVALVASASGLAFVSVMKIFGDSGKLSERISFGPFLAVGFWTVWLSGYGSNLVQ